MTATVMPTRIDTRAPLNNVDRLSTPVLLLQGLEDKVVPPSQAELFAEMKARIKEVEERARTYRLASAGSAEPAPDSGSQWMLAAVKQVVVEAVPKTQDTAFERIRLGLDRRSIHHVIKDEVALIKGVVRSRELNRSATVLLNEFR